jgi:quercetin 2,3-dioxygenase
MAYKTLQKVLPSPGSHWVGDGFRVQPVFADLAFTNEISPFLMFDYASPKNFEPTKAKLGVGQHPHRGFETVTIAFQGEVEHGDSVGNR